ncbi:hypothetical protein KAR91_59650 [Candidatus Pacearchaeota archaeon]|nr:hypothetical protein [Candidatus Pacearchaeota archaeon]
MIERKYKIKDPKILTKLISKSLQFIDVSVESTPDSSVVIRTSSNVTILINKNVVTISGPLNRSTRLTSIVIDNCERIKDTHIITLSDHDLRYIQDVDGLLKNHLYCTLTYIADSPSMIAKLISNASAEFKDYSISSEPLDTLILHLKPLKVVSQYIKTRYV